jgi:hypothetical protein
MNKFVPAGMWSRVELGRIGLIGSALLAIASCSKTDVHLADGTKSEPIVLAQNSNAQKTAAARLIEIEQQLAAPPTGRPEESDRRTALRAEREALIASGQVPYRQAPPSFTSRVANTPPNNTLTQRYANGNVVNTALPTQRTEPITVTTNSQDKNLPFLEQMTPTEREHYLKTIKAHNTITYDVNVRRR